MRFPCRIYNIYNVTFKLLQIQILFILISQAVKELILDLSTRQDEGLSRVVKNMLHAKYPSRFTLKIQVLFFIFFS